MITGALSVLQCTNDISALSWLLVHSHDQFAVLPVTQFQQLFLFLNKLFMS